MDLFHFLIIFTFVLIQTETKSISVEDHGDFDSQRIVLKLPKVLNHETKIKIVGSTTNTANFSITVSEEIDGEEICEIIFKPTDGSIVTMTNVQTISAEYNFFVTKPGHVFFKLDMMARNDLDTKKIDLHFEANEAGENKIDSCVFTTLENLQYIVLKGVEHVETLSFNFKKATEPHR